MTAGFRSEWGIIVVEIGRFLTCGGPRGLGLHRSRLVSLEFGDRALHATWSATGMLAQHSIQEDWALLQLVAPPPHPAQPLPLAGVRFDPNPVSWDTWGFPTVAAQEGTGYEGESAIEAEVFEVSCTSLLQSMVDGISGAPFVVGGDVRGIVQQAYMSPDAQGRVRVEDSKLRVRSLRSLVSAVGDRLRWDDYADLPFEPQVREAVTGLFKDLARLPNLGAKVGVNVSVVRGRVVAGQDRPSGPAKWPGALRMAR